MQRLLACVDILPGGDQHDSASFEAESLTRIDLTIKFGADNASAKTETFSYSKDALARDMLTKLEDNIREMMTPGIGVWRNNLITGLKEDS